MNQRAVQTQAFGSWKSPLSIEKYIEYSPLRFGQLESNSDTLFWIESRPSEDGRQCIMAYQGAEPNTLTPVNYSVRTRVHEYGGNAYCVSEDYLWFVNDKDQDIYQQSLAHIDEITRLTHTESSERYADLVHIKNANLLIGIRETHGIAEEAINDIVAIGAEDGKLQVLQSGHDFYAHARVSPDESRLAYIAWDHPNMPWNGTQLYVQDFNRAASTSQLIAGGTEESVVQPEWLNDQELVYCSDSSGYWDLYVFSDEGSRILAADQREYGYALWQLGTQKFIPLNQQHLLASPNPEELLLIEASSGLQSPIEEESGNIGGVTKYKEGIAFFSSSSMRSAEIRVKPSFTSESQPIRKGKPFPLNEEDISIADSITFNGSNDEMVHAYYYAPKNHLFRGEAGEKPPLLVLAHGGPTGSTSKGLNASIQFFTSRGWAVLDVNYSGSTGFGKDYRNRLFNEWGNRDVEDLAAGVRHLVSQDLADPNRVAIAGGSAGGYTVLRALSTTSTFKAGACRYGIADLRVLANETHKFESRYIDQLVPREQLDERSPIHHINQINSPVVFFQGSEDRVVPPNQAQMMYESLSAKQLPTALFMFEGEQHGFRKLETQIKVVSAEYWFFSQAFHFNPHGLDESALVGCESANLDRF